MTYKMIKKIKDLEDLVKINKVLTFTTFLLKELLHPTLFQFDEIYILATNIKNKSYLYLKNGIDKKISKQALYNMLPILNEYKKEQIDSLIEVYYNDLNDNEE